GRAQPADVGDARVVELRSPGEEEDVDDDAGGVEPDGGVDDAADELREEVRRRLRAVDVRDIRAEDERRLPRPAYRLEEARLARRELDGVRARVDEGEDGALDVLDAGEERGLAEEPVVDRDVEAPPVGRKEPVHARVHRPAS